MAVLPITATPFFASKNRAFWNLQFAGWGGAMLLRAVSGIANGLDLSFFIFVLIETITGFSISLVLSVIYRQLISRRPLVTWGATALLLAVAVSLYTFIGTWLNSLIRPESEAAFAVRFLSYFIFPLTLLGAWSALYYAINFFLKVEEQADRLERLEARATSAQLAMLRYQLNPHFLFNTLNSISTLVLLKQTEPANAMLTRLSAFLRQTLITDPGSEVTLAQEVETLKLYLGIERMRFEERLRTEFHIEPEAARAQLPAMLLQPLVENAIKYAVTPQEEGAQIRVDARLVGKRLRVVVSDTGPGLQRAKPGSTLAGTMAEQTRAVSTGVGLANIRDRLKQAYGEEHRFEIRTPPNGGFTVIIELPYSPETPPAAAPPDQAAAAQGSPAPTQIGHSA